MTQLTNIVKTIQVLDAVAAGSSNVTTAAVVDMQGFEGVRFIYSFGAITAGAVTSVGAATLGTNNPAFGTDDIAGCHQAVADTADDTVFILDIYKPQLRYIRPWVARATQNAVVNSIVAELYSPTKKPVVADASVTGQLLMISPGKGTA